jgi:teichoic acid transport system permease protein
VRLPYGQPPPAEPGQVGHPPGYLPFGQPTPDPAPPHPPAAPAGPTQDATALIPRVAMYETAILPKAVVPPSAPPSLAELAARHGLKPAGTRPTLAQYTRQLWRFREFITFYAQGRVKASVGNARLGRLWLLLTPLLNAAVYFVIFGVVLQLGRNVPNFVGYLTAGFFVFVYTQTTAQHAVSSISGQLGLVRAMQFPRASLPIATILIQAQNFFISLLVLLGIAVATGERVSTNWAWLPAGLVLVTLFNSGLALILARLGARIADLKQVLPFAMRAWMYMSAVFYSVDMYSYLPPLAQTILHWNPMLVYIELVRYAVLADVPLSSPLPDLLIKGGVWAVVVLVIGYVYFWRGEAEYGRG